MVREVSCERPAAQACMLTIPARQPLFVADGAFGSRFLRCCDRSMSCGFELIGCFKQLPESVAHFGLLLRSEHCSIPNAFYDALAIHKQNSGCAVNLVRSQ